MANKDDDGDLLFDLRLCLERNIPIPPRISTAFIDLVQRGYHGEFRSWDEAFGKPCMNPEKIAKFERRMAETRKVVEEVKKRKGSLNEGAFEAIGRETGVGGKTKVKELLSEQRFWAARWNALLELGRNFPKNFRR